MTFASNEAEAGKAGHGRLEWSNGALRCLLNASDGSRIEAFGRADGAGWIPAGRAGRDFAVTIDDKAGQEAGGSAGDAPADGKRTIDGFSADLRTVDMTEDASVDGAIVRTLWLKHEPTGLLVGSSYRLFAGAAVMEKWL